ncbi:hypothetical protein OIV83_005170 [Microbotryomycetes sp. JL201]|nr:hypothetical protein OIV83_005170 [Microbotryomycetes sp. JL201]
MHGSPSRSIDRSGSTYPPHLVSPRSIADEFDAVAATSRASTRQGSTSQWRDMDTPRLSFSSCSGTPHRRTTSASSPAARDHASSARGPSAAHRKLLFDDTAGSATPIDDRDFIVNVPGGSATSRGKQREYSRDDFDEDEHLQPMLDSSLRPRLMPATTTKARISRKLKSFYIALAATVICMAFVSARTATSPNEWSETIDKWKVQAKAWTGASRPEGPTSGGNGSVVTTATGKQFVYINELGGHWNSTPFSLDAQAQSYTPPLGAQWDYSKQRIMGVNLGGWLNLEPFITPGVFEPYLKSKVPATDEWSLCQNLGWSKRRIIERHYDTFITEEDFANIAAAGINWVRIPLPHWAVQSFDGEPFVSQVAWKYFVKATVWARKYGIRINLDLHTVPGSQKCALLKRVLEENVALTRRFPLSGWNHSGRYGSVGFLNGVMGVTNAQRTLNIIRALAEFVSRPENSPVIPMMTVLNEPFMRTTGVHALRTFYLEAYRTIRRASGMGIGHGPMIVIHDGFKGTRMWHGWLEGADRIALESHRYLAFRPPNDDPMDLQMLKPCQNWGSDFNRTMSKVGLAITGEWSIATNDCGMFLNGVGVGTRYEGTYPTPELSEAPGVAPVGACDEWSDHTTWSDERKDQLLALAKAHMDAFQNWFYWTWKTLPPLNSDVPANPRWNYFLGWREGWLPKDPRTANGFCAWNAERLGVPPPKQYKFKRPLHNYQVGLPFDERDPLSRELGDINATHLGAWGRFPPETVGTSPNRLDVALLPQLIKSHKPREGEIRLHGPRPDNSIEDSVYDDLMDNDRSGWWVPVKACKYLNSWEGVGAPVPQDSCVTPKS